MVDIAKTAVRTLSVTLPDSIADLVETMAREQNLSLNEVFLHAIRSLEFDLISLSVERARPQSSKNAEEQDMDEVYRMIKKTRRSGEERKTA